MYSMHGQTGGKHDNMAWQAIGIGIGDAAVRGQNPRRKTYRLPSQPCALHAAPLAMLTDRLTLKASRADPDLPTLHTHLYAHALFQDPHRNVAHFPKRHHGYSLWMDARLEPGWAAGWTQDSALEWTTILDKGCNLASLRVDTEHALCTFFAPTLIPDLPASRLLAQVFELHGSTTSIV